MIPSGSRSAKTSTSLLTYSSVTLAVNKQEYFDVDDFKPRQQPEQQPTDKPEGDFQATYENKPETYVTPTGEPTTLSAAPQPSLEIPKKKRSGAKKAILWGVVVLLLAGTGALAYWQWTEADTAKKELNSTQTQLETAQADLAKADAGADEPVTSTPTTEDAVKFAAGFYACNLADFGCDKVVTTVTKTQAWKSAAEPGFAIAKATSAMNKTTNLYLKTVDNLTWVVIYEGTTAPSEEVVKKYAIPTGFVAQ